MLTTKQKLLRRFWHATVPVAALARGPVAFRLMGEDIVLFLAEDGQPAALADRCCHRTAKLSKGHAEAGRIVCGYHGWTYDHTGALTRIPQFDPATPLPKHSVPAFNCAERYGYAWVALEDPLTPIIDIPEDRDPAFRRIHQFYESWDTAPLRLMENSFDNAHFSFVHKGTFGVSQPKPSKYEIEETAYGFRATTVVEVVNPEAAWPVTGCTTPTTTRTMDNHWVLPFCRRMDMLYPSGIRHIIVNAATPMEDGKLQLVQLLFRNDTEAACSTETLIAWDAAIVAEDKEILECTDPDAVLDQALKAEKHRPSDRPGLIMRRRLLELLQAHGEAEVTNAQPT
jgi:phenylpropionate dioxygenase-like ring-hydroxylating dioxygenase large terminal subunit